MKRYLYTVLLLAAFCSMATAQESYKEKFTEGSYLLLEENYPKALELFLGAYNIDSSSANINYHLGLCYINSVSEKYKAQYYLQKSIAKVSDKYVPMEPTEKRAPVLAYYYLAKSYHLNYRFDEAIAYFEKFKSYLNAKQESTIKDVDRQIATCNTAKEFYAAPNKVTITNMGDSVNSPYPEYSPVISADESTLIFTSRRLGSTGGEKTIDEQFYEDIYICTRKPDGTWSSPVSISDSINTNSHEANLGLSADGQQLLVYKDDKGDGNIYSSVLNGDKWSKPALMGSDINTRAWEPSACVSADGNTFYFVSDRKEGGFGGRDLYSCVRLPNGKWSLARNLGPGVNTEYDEEAPFLHPDGVTLFFSSKGHKGMGGFDIFFVSKNEDGKWVDPINMGSPINTPDDDVFYVTSTDGKRAYYSSVREGGFGEKDLYLVTLAEGQKVEPVALILGRLIPGEGKPMPEDNEINVTNVESGETAICRANTKTGKFVISLKPGKSYNISYNANGAEVFKETIDVPLGIEYQEIKREIYLDGEKNISLVISKDKTTPDSAAVAVVKDKPVKDTPVKDKPVKDKPVRDPVKPIKPCDDLVFKVQLGSFKKKLTKEHFGVPQMETVQTPSGAYKYFSGIYKTYEEAKVLQKIVREKGNKDAFIVSVNCGKITKVDSSVIVAAIDMEKTKSSDPSAFGRFSDRHYEVFFKYNVKEIDINDPEFQRFIAFIIADVNERGQSTIALVSSASQVPTRAFKSNKELSINRAQKAKDNIAKALREKGVDETKVVYQKFKSYVNGPQYKGDYLLNRETYEKYQYVKVDIIKK